MEKKPAASSSASASSAPSWRALAAKEAKAEKAKAAKAAKAAKDSKEAKAKEAKAAKEAKEIKQGQARKQREDSLTLRHNARAFRRAAAEEKAEKEEEKLVAELAKFLSPAPELSQALAQAQELTRALAQVPAEAHNIRLYPAPGFVLSWTAPSPLATPAASAPASKPSAPSAPSQKALARKAKADARARLGLGKAKSVPRVRTADASALSALRSASATALAAASSASAALKTEKAPAKRQELHQTYAKASVWAQGLDVQATVAELVGIVDGFAPSELSVVPFAAKAKTQQRRHLLWVGRKIGRGLTVKRAEAREALATALAKAESEIAAAPEELDEFGAWYLENQSRAKLGLAPLAPLAPEITVGEAEDWASDFDQLVKDLEAQVKELSYERDLERFCGPGFFEGELHDAVAAYSEGQCSWNEALEAVLAKCFAHIRQDQEGGSNE